MHGICSPIEYVFPVSGSNGKGQGMRLWSLHPRYLDSKGLVALWREGLLARKVLAGGTRGYRNHPQLRRFRESPDPLGAIDRYLSAVLEEADLRGYRFNRGKIRETSFPGRLAVARGQVEYEREHLLRKLGIRDPKRQEALRDEERPVLHPLFKIVEGGMAEWEKAHG